MWSNSATLSCCSLRDRFDMFNVTTFILLFSLFWWSFEMLLLLLLLNGIIFGAVEYVVVTAVGLNVVYKLTADDLFTLFADAKLVELFVLLLTVFIFELLIFISLLYY